MPTRKDTFPLPSHEGQHDHEVNGRTKEKNLNLRNFPFEHQPLSQKPHRGKSEAAEHHPRKSDPRLVGKSKRRRARHLLIGSRHWGPRSNLNAKPCLREILWHHPIRRP